jgi:hypothetical protein
LEKGQLGFRFLRTKQCCIWLVTLTQEPTPGSFNIHAAAKVGASAHVGVRLIQHSPAADPKLVEEARRFARELKEKEGPKEDPINPNPEAPLIVQQ